MFRLGFKLVLTSTLLPPLIDIVCAYTSVPVPYALGLRFAFPFLSIIVFVSFLLPSAIVPPVPLKPTETLLTTVYASTYSPSVEAGFIISRAGTLHPLLGAD